MQNEGIYDEIGDRWSQVFADMRCAPQPRDRFAAVLQEVEANVRSATMTAFQPNIAIFEFGLEFISYVHIVLSSKDAPGPSSGRVRAAWALTGAAISFGASIRSLVISGHDTPARALLRTYVEALFLCIAVLYDQNLADAYVAAESDEQVKNFWHTKASPKNLHKKIIDIEKQFGLEQQEMDEMKNYRIHEYEALSQSSHLSYAVSVMTIFAEEITKKDHYTFGSFGAASSGLHRTIHYAMVTTWYFSVMTRSVLLGKEGEKFAILLDKEDEWQQKMWASSQVLSELVLKYYTGDTGCNSSNIELSE